MVFVIVRKNNKQLEISTKYSAILRPCHLHKYYKSLDILCCSLREGGSRRRDDTTFRTTITGEPLINIMDVPWP